jgi:hypothetical protein
MMVANAWVLTLKTKVVVAVRHLVYRIDLKRLEWSLPKPNVREDALIKEFRIHILKQMPSFANITWIDFVAELKRYAFFYDPRTFLRWRVIERTMFVVDQTYIPNELHALQASSDWEQLWKAAIVEQNVGCPTPSPHLFTTSGNLIHHAYHLLKLREAVGANFDQIETVFEFGGGYGSMCRLLRRVGFHGDYVIYDLPEMTLLQKFYLGMLDPTFDMSNTVLINTLSELEKATAHQRDRKGSLFIAAWSLSETPILLRNQILSLVKGFDYYLFCYQPRFDDVDNVEFFKHYADERHDVSWNSWRCSGYDSYYLVGKKTAP